MLPTSTPLDPHHQLRRAIERLPNPEGQCADHARIHVGREELPKGPHAHPPPSRGPADVDFHRETLTLDDGRERRVWVYDGPVEVAPTYLTDSSDHDALGEWLRAQLGRRCVDVSVQGVDDHAARVRVLATTEDELPLMKGA